MLAEQTNGWANAVQSSISERFPSENKFSRAKLVKAVARVPQSTGSLG